MAKQKNKKANPSAGPSAPEKPSAPVTPGPGRSAPSTQPPDEAVEQNSERHLWEFTWARDLMILMVIGLFFFLIYLSRAILIPVLVGLVLAYIFNPIITWANVRLKIPRVVAVSLLLASLFITATCALLYLGPLAVRQATGLVQATARYTNKIAQEVPVAGLLRDQFLRAINDKTSGMLHAATQPADTEPDADAPEASTQPATAPALPATQAGTDTQPETQPDTQPATQPAMGFLARLTGPDLINALSSVNWPAVFTFLLGSLNLGLSVVGYTFGMVGYGLLAAGLIAFCFFSFSCNFQRVVDTAASYVPADYQEETFRIARKMDSTIAAIIRGRLIQAAALMVLLSAGWGMADVPYWLLLGVVAGGLNLLPYAASIGLPAAILAVWINRSSAGMPFDPMAILVWPSVVYFIAQGIDGWIIEPWVQGKATNLSALSVLLAVLIGASIAGLAGMLLAIPVTACMKIFYEEFVQPRLMAYLHKNRKQA